MVLTAAVVAVGCTRPQLWRDEFATWSAAHRPLAALTVLTGHIDGVLEPYYLAMHGWISLVGDSVLAMRLPSLAAVTATAGLTAAIGAVLQSGRAGLYAGLLYTAIPSTSRYGEEARPYAAVALATTLATLLLLLALRQRRRRLWCAYAIAIAAVGALHLVALLVLVGHVILLLQHAATARSPRTLLRPAGAIVAGLAPLIPLAVRGQHQAARELGHRLPVTNLHTLAALPASLCDSVPAGVALLMLAAAGALLPRTPMAPFAVLVATPLAAFAAVGYVEPLFNPRYAVFAVPLACVLAGAALARLRPPVAIAVIVVVALGGVPDQVLVRRSHESRGDPLIDYRAAAQIVRDHRRPGDAIVYRRDGWQFADIALEYYLRDDSPTDVLASGDRNTVGSYWTPEVSNPASALAGIDRVWAVMPDSLIRPFRPLPLDARTQKGLDLHQVAVQRWRLSGLTVALYQRTSAGLDSPRR